MAEPLSKAICHGAICKANCTRAFFKHALVSVVRQQLPEWWLLFLFLINSLELHDILFL